MSKTAEEIYEERLTAATRQVVLDFIDGGVDYEQVRDIVGLTEDPDFISDVVIDVNAELDTMIQRWLDD